MIRQQNCSISSVVALEELDVDHVDFGTVVFPAYMGANVGRFLRSILTIRTAKSRQHPAFKLQV